MSYKQTNINTTKQNKCNNHSSESWAMRKELLRKCFAEDDNNNDDNNSKDISIEELLKGSSEASNAINPSLSPLSRSGRRNKVCSFEYPKNSGLSSLLESDNNDDNNNNIGSLNTSIQRSKSVGYSDGKEHQFTFEDVIGSSPSKQKPILKLSKDEYEQSYYSLLQSPTPQNQSNYVKMFDDEKSSDNHNDEKADKKCTIYIGIHQQ